MGAGEWAGVTINCVGGVSLGSAWGAFRRTVGVVGEQWRLSDALFLLS
jgi:hypothetical protein